MPTPEQMLMIEDGLPPEFIRNPKETTMPKKPAGPKEQQVAALKAAKHDAPAKTETPIKRQIAKKAVKAEKILGRAHARAAKKAAPAPRAKPPKASPEVKAVREGSKLAIIVALLKRPGGCTTAEVLKATDWPSVSMPQQAKAAGLELRKESKDGTTVYYVV